MQEYCLQIIEDYFTEPNSSSHTLHCFLYQAVCSGYFIYFIFHDKIVTEPMALQIYSAGQKTHTTVWSYSFWDGFNMFPWVLKLKQ